MELLFESIPTQQYKEMRFNESPWNLTFASKHKIILIKYYKKDYGKSEPILSSTPSIEETAMSKRMTMDLDTIGYEDLVWPDNTLGSMADIFDKEPDNIRIMDENGSMKFDLRIDSDGLDSGWNSPEQVQDTVTSHVVADLGTQQYWRPQGFVTPLISVSDHPGSWVYSYMYNAPGVQELFQWYLYYNRIILTIEAVPQYGGFIFNPELFNKKNSFVN